MPTVINVCGMAPNSPGILYVGRECYGWTASPLANRFKINKRCCRDQAIEHYRFWLEGRVRNKSWFVMKALCKIQEDSVLGCWCAPKKCHADVIIDAWRRLREAGDLELPTFHLSPEKHKEVGL